MLYVLHEYIRSWLVANDLYRFTQVLDRIEFRALLASGVAFLVVLLLGPRTIGFLTRMKIGDSGLSDAEVLKGHAATKSNVPTMGGLLIVGAIGAGVLLLADVSRFYILMGLVVLVWHAVLGGFDDYLKLTAKHRGTGSRQGLYAWEKLSFQLGIGVLVGWFAYQQGRGVEAPASAAESGIVAPFTSEDNRPSLNGDLTAQSSTSGGSLAVKPAFATSPDTGSQPSSLVRTEPKADQAASKARGPASDRVGQRNRAGDKILQPQEVSTPLEVRSENQGGQRGTAGSDISGSLRTSAGEREGELSTGLAGSTQAADSPEPGEGVAGDIRHVLNLPFQRTYEPGGGGGQTLNPNLIFLSMPVFILFATLMVAGMSNAVNVTDGMDGLAAGISTAVSIGVFVLCLIAGNQGWAQYLLLPYVPEAGELAVLAGATAGACLGFLWWNSAPAAVFMGDTGALCLGGILGYIAVIIRQEFVIIIMSMIFIIELGSVALQVGCYKATKHRVNPTTGKRGWRPFTIAPYHHNLHVRGWPEEKIVARFWIISVIMVVLAMAMLKVR